MQHSAEGFWCFLVFWFGLFLVLFLFGPVEVYSSTSMIPSPPALEKSQLNQSSFHGILTSLLLLPVICG